MNENLNHAYLTAVVKLQRAVADAVMGASIFIGDHGPIEPVCAVDDLDRISDALLDARTALRRIQNATAFFRELDQAEAEIAAEREAL